MPERTAVICTECEQVYAARERDDGSFILPTNDPECECGNNTFVELDKEEVDTD